MSSTEYFTLNIGDTLAWSGTLTTTVNTVTTNPVADGPALLKLSLSNLGAPVSQPLSLSIGNLGPNGSVALAVGSKNTGCVELYSLAPSGGSNLLNSVMAVSAPGALIPVSLSGGGRSQVIAGDPVSSTLTIADAAAAELNLGGALSFDY